MFIIYHDINLDIIDLKIILREHLPAVDFSFKLISQERYEKISDYSYSASHLLKATRDVTNRNFIAVTNKKLTPVYLKDGRCVVISINPLRDVKYYADLVAKSYLKINKDISSIGELVEIELSQKDKGVIGRIKYNPIPSRVHVIISHGINTDAHWAEAARETLVDYGISASICRYGFVEILSLLLPWKKTNYEQVLLAHILREYSNNPHKRLSISVHSLGTIVLIRSLALAKSLNIVLPIDLIILSGSVLPQDLDWNELTYSNDSRNISVNRILNVCGERDTVPLLAKAIKKIFGNSGSLFFSDNYSGNLINIRLPNKTHKTVIDKQTIDEYWIPHLIGPSRLSHPNVNHIEPSNYSKFVRLVTRLLNRHSLKILLIVALIVTADNLVHMHILLF